MLHRGSSSKAEAAEEKTADASVEYQQIQAKAEGLDQRSLDLLIMGLEPLKAESIMDSKLGGSGSRRTAPLGRS